MLCCDYSVLDPMCQDHNILVVAAVPCDPRREKISSLLRVVASSVQRRQITQAQKPASQIWKAFGGNSASCQPVRWAESKFPHLSPRVIAGTGPPIRLARWRLWRAGNLLDVVAIKQAMLFISVTRPLDLDEMFGIVFGKPERCAPHARFILEISSRIGLALLGGCGRRIGVAGCSEGE
jgi:hypothetical protein